MPLLCWLTIPFFFLGGKKKFQEESFRVDNFFSGFCLYIFLFINLTLPDTVWNSLTFITQVLKCFCGSVSTWGPRFIQRTVGALNERVSCLVSLPSPSVAASFGLVLSADHTPSSFLLQECLLISLGQDHSLFPLRKSRENPKWT